MKTGFIKYNYKNESDKLEMGLISYVFVYNLDLLPLAISGLAIRISFSVALLIPLRNRDDEFDLS